LETTPFLIVGLGNPGAKYADTYHNLGFVLIDRLLGVAGKAAEREKFDGLLSEASFGGKKVLLFKPMKYMNLSGGPVNQVVQFYKIPIETNLLVVFDDLDTPAATLRLRLSGGPGGHNGLSHIIQMLGSEKFPRLRIGIGRPADASAEGYVLSKIPKSQQAAYADALQLAVQGIESILKEGVAKAMNIVNQKRNP
jgi:peptidyl-tRNA hydrolase, PTH1 family